LVPLANRHLGEANINFGHPPSGLSGWLWLCFALRWSGRAGRLGYAIRPGGRPDAFPPTLGVHYASPESSGPAEFFPPFGFRWGDWMEDRVGSGPPAIHAYRLDSDIRKASALAIGGILRANDLWQEIIERATQALSDCGRAGDMETTIPLLQKECREAVVASQEAGGTASPSCPATPTVDEVQSLFWA